MPMKHQWDWYLKGLLIIAICVGVVGFVGYQLYNAVSVGVIVMPGKGHSIPVKYRDDPFSFWLSVFFYIAWLLMFACCAVAGVRNRLQKKSQIRTDPDSN
jgi:hypothetical protein